MHLGCLLIRFANKEIMNILSAGAIHYPEHTIIFPNLFINDAINFEGNSADLKLRSKSLRNLDFSSLLIVNTLKVL